MPCCQRFPSRCHAVLIIRVLWLILLSKVAQNLDALLHFDYRVRTQIRECLEINYSRNRDQPFAAHIAFQLAFCYHVGFGIESNNDTCYMWLDKSNKRPDDLEAEKKAVQPARWGGGGMPGHDGFVWVDLTHEYRTQGLKTLDQAREECERVINDMARVFGELHFILLNLYATRGNLLDELGKLSESKELRMRIREQIEKTNGINHPYYIQSIMNVARSHEKLGEWREAQQLREEVLANIEGTTYGAGGLKPESRKQSIIFNSIINLVQGGRIASFLHTVRHYLSGNKSLFTIST